MPSITLKNIPEPLYRQLTDIARSHHRSLTQELVVALESYVSKPRRKNA
jgi:plasmid stability protein